MANETCPRVKKLADYLKEAEGTGELDKITAPIATATVNPAVAGEPNGAGNVPAPTPLSAAADEVKDKSKDGVITAAAASTTVVQASDVSDENKTDPAPAVAVPIAAVAGGVSSTPDAAITSEQIAANEAYYSAMKKIDSLNLDDLLKSISEDLDSLPVDDGKKKEDEKKEDDKKEEENPAKEKFSDDEDGKGINEPTEEVKAPEEKATPADVKDDADAVKDVAATPETGDADDTDGGIGDLEIADKAVEDAEKDDEAEPAKTDQAETPSGTENIVQTLFAGADVDDDSAKTDVAGTVIQTIRSGATVDTDTDAETAGLHENIEDENPTGSVASALGNKSTVINAPAEQDLTLSAKQVIQTIKQAADVCDGDGACSLTAPSADGKVAVAAAVESVKEDATAVDAKEPADKVPEPIPASADKKGLSADVAPAPTTPSAPVTDATTAVVDAKAVTDTVAAASDVVAADKAKATVEEEYSNLKGAIAKGAGYFKDSAKKQKLTEQVALTIAMENDDRGYTELKRLLSEAAAVRSALVYKYSTIAKNRTDELLESMNVASVKIETKPSLFKPLTEDILVSKAKTEAAKAPLADSKVIY